MEELKVKIRIHGWNSVNVRNLEKVLKNSKVRCNGRYTDDYKWDEERNFDMDLSSEECKIRISGSDIRPKLYYDSRDKTFVIFYGHWLSYTAVPKTLKVIEEKVEEGKFPKMVESLKNALQERENWYVKVMYPSLTPDEVSVKNRKKYYAVDIGSSGKFLIDKKSFEVWGIKGYGVKGHYLGKIGSVINNLLKDVEGLKKVENEEVKIVRLSY